MSVVPLLIAFGLLVLAAGVWPWKRSHMLKWLLRIMSCILSISAFALAGHGIWLESRAMPEALEAERIFRGVTYTRDVRGTPRPMVIHVVTVDVMEPGIELVVTPPDGEGAQPLKARTTSSFLTEEGLQVAVNGSFFYPWYSEGPLHSYPHQGDPVSVRGLAISRGERYSPDEPAYRTLYATRDNRISIGRRIDPIWNAISGREVFLREGELNRDFSYLSHPNEPSPRTVVAVDASNRLLSLFAVDGRQPGVSEGVTLPEMAQIVREHGGVTALHMDGGGSTTLVVEDTRGRPRRLNCPIHKRIPCLERPVANHLGIRAKQVPRASR